MAMTMSDELVVRTGSGDLRGQSENAINVFRGVPYAKPPVGELRFKPPQPMPAWSGVRDAVADGPIAPQGRSRLAHVMGDFERPQSEDCLALTLWAPPSARKAPVVVWIHGGAFSSGAGSLPWYSGETFAKNGIVAVSLNYRLGALGFLYLPGISDGNLGIQDQALALRWVRDNIAAFGGDPDNVTLVGQSAGGSSITALMVMQSARGLFRRAILQSAPFGRLLRTAEDAHRMGKRFLEMLGLKPEDAAKLKALPPEKLVAAQGELGRAEKKFADAAPPFGLVIDGTVIPKDISAALDEGAGRDIDIMIGTTREEMAAFYVVDKEVQTADEAAVESVFKRLFGAEYRPYLQEARDLRPSGTSAAILGDIMSDNTFRLGSLRFAETRADQGRPAFVFQFDWQAKAGFESCHCIEIPFMFDNLPNWPDSPMLKGADPREMAGLAKAMHGAWVAFARTGNPNFTGLPDWPTYRREDRMTMRFDSIIGAVGDLAGLAWRKPWPKSAQV